MQVKDIVRKVKQIEVRTRKKTDASLMGQYHSAFKGQGMTFAEVRQYQFGDDIRRIDWNKTARFQSPFVKIMEEERELTMMFLIDISASMNYGTHSQLKKEFVAEICASIGFSAVGNNDKVGMILFADKVYKVIPPQKGKKHILSMISQILSTEYIPSQSNTDKALEYVMSVFKKKSFLFLFSDFNDPIQNKILKIATKKHELLGIRVTEEKDWKIPKVGYAEFLDVESGEKVWVNTSSDYFQNYWKQKREERKKNIDFQFEQASASLLDISLDEDYAKKLRQYFNRKK
ncbi:DUF58 domain-containing protein [Bergeyella zoohelcum]|nr:DUF58 domain-containing protein [Bergeyella zoohelcum]VDH02721.1 Uncharacterized conserved protein (some members contain a von Willebrand factor type A (vWA) domain) [Bergeyella zoohelcum]